MPANLALALPAAAASLAYLSARTQIGHDASVLHALIRFQLRVRRLERLDRINFFYNLEERALAGRDAGRTWLLYEGRTWTWREAYDEILRCAAWLKGRHGVKSRQTVTLDFTNKPSYLFLIFALWSLGALPALINTNITGDGLVHSLRTAEGALVIVDEEVAGNFTDEVLQNLSSQQEGKGPVQVVVFDAAVEKEIAGLEGFRADDKERSGAGVASGYTSAFLVFTSGTTGLPKAAIVGYFKAYAAPSYVTHWMGLKSDDVFYTCMPLYHIAALLMGCLSTVYVGCSFALGHKFSVRSFWLEVRASDATVIQYVGETCRYLLSAPPQTDPVTGADLDKQHRVRLAHGNGLRPDIWQRFSERFAIPAIAEFFSATESPYGTWNLTRNAYGVGAVGRFGSLLRQLAKRKFAIVQVDWATETPLRVPSPDGKHAFCQLVGPNEPGEMLNQLNPDAVSISYQGYHNNRAASGSKILRDVFAPGDVWYRTGDVLRQDAEGRVFFADRIGDTFRWRAENVATTEVAEALGTFPAIDEANVYGVAIPHHDGQAGCAAVMFAGSEETAEPSGELLRGLAAHASERLPKYAVPLFVRAVRSMGKTGTNKPQKHILRREGVDPAHLKLEERLYWLQEGTYVPFTQRDWQRLQGGLVRL